MYSFLEPELRSDDEDSDSDESPVEDTEETHNIVVRNVSSKNRCSTKNARRLCIFHLFYKFCREDRYDIGGCYTEESPDLWFYYTTTVCPNQVYLLNLFVCHRGTGSFALGISSSNEHSYQKLKDYKIATLPDTLTWYRFQSVHKDQNHYVKTFSFNCDQKNKLRTKVLYIPMAVTMQPPFSLNSDLIEAIKLDHNTNKISSLGKEDFALISKNGTKYPVHKIIVAAHSTVLKKAMTDHSSSLLLDLADQEVELLIQYMYTGVIKDISKHDLFKLLEFSYKYELMSLFIVTKQLIEKDINVNNAIDVALTAKKCNLGEMQAKAFDYIKKCPHVLNTEGWKNLDDAELAKSLYHHSQKNDENCVI